MSYNDACADDWDYDDDMFQDEDEGVAEDGDGASVCSQRGDDSWLDPHTQSTIIIKTTKYLRISN